MDLQPATTAPWKWKNSDLDGIVDREITQLTQAMPDGGRMQEGSSDEKEVVDPLALAKEKRSLALELLGENKGALKLKQLYMALKRQAKLIHFLIGKGASVDAHVYGELLTPLHMAVRKNNAMATHILLDHGADIGKTNAAEQTAWKYAKSFGADVIREIISERYKENDRKREEALEKIKEMKEDGGGIFEWLCGRNSFSRVA
jgi:hypothetical protein